MKTRPVTLKTYLLCISLLCMACSTSIGQSSCLPVANLTTTVLTSNSYQVSWTSTSVAASYSLQVLDMSGNVDYSTVAGANETSKTVITNLSNFQIWVTTFCPNGGQTVNNQTVMTVTDVNSTCIDLANLTEQQVLKVNGEIITIYEFCISYCLEHEFSCDEFDDSDGPDMPDDSDIRNNKNHSSNENSININLVNPAEGHLLKGWYELDEAAEININIYDSQGRLVEILMKGLQQKRGSYSFRKDVSQLSPGIYFLELINNKTRSIKRFVKTN